MQKTDVQRWLDAYVAAWKSYDREAIAALFAADVEYRYHPYDEPVRGRDAVVASWLGEEDHDGASERDEEGTYDGSYIAIAVDGDTAVATGTSTYTKPPEVYHNCYVLSFDADGRCTRFTEWFMKQPEDDRG
jgi:ketosteroid isomerase-like protein